MSVEKFDRSAHDAMCERIDNLFELCADDSLNLGSVATQSILDQTPEPSRTHRLGQPGTYDVHADKVAAFGPSIFPGFPK